MMARAFAAARHWAHGFAQLAAEPEFRRNVLDACWIVPVATALLILALGITP